MSKKNQPKNEQKPKEQTFPTFEDHFTQFLEKRKKYFTQKLEEIEKLEKSDQSTLKPDQKQKINNKPETLEKIKYFDDIKQLYFEASSKKGITAPQSAQKSPDVRDSLICDFVSLFSVGQAIHNFEKNSQGFEHHFNSEQMTTVQDVYNSLTKQPIIQHLESTKEKLKNYCENDQLRQSVKSFLDSHKNNEEKKPQIEEAKPKEQPVQTKQPLFVDSDDEHEEEEKPKEKQTQSGNANEQDDSKQVHVPSGLLKPLPEDDKGNVDEFKANTKKHSGKYRNRPHGDRPHGDRPHGDRPQGDRKDRPFQKKPHHEGEQPAPAQGEGQVQTQEGHQRHDNEKVFHKKPYVPREGDRNFSGKANFYDKDGQHGEKRFNKGEYQGRHNNNYRSKRNDDDGQYQRKEERAE